VYILRGVQATAPLTPRIGPMTSAMCSGHGHFGKEVQKLCIGIEVRVWRVCYWLEASIGNVQCANGKGHRYGSRKRMTSVLFKNYTSPSISLP
jgi:hypothetical protein